MSMSRAHDNASVFSVARSLVPGLCPGSATAADSAPQTSGTCRVSQLVRLVENKTSSCNLSRELSCLQDHEAMRRIVDAADMQEAKQGLENAATTLKVRCKSSPCSYELFAQSSYVELTSPCNADPHVP